MGLTILKWCQRCPCPKRNLSTCESTRRSLDTSHFKWSSTRKWFSSTLWKKLETLFLWSAAKVRTANLRKKCLSVFKKGAPWPNSITTSRILKICEISTIWDSIWCPKRNTLSVLGSVIMEAILKLCTKVGINMLKMEKTNSQKNCIKFVPKYKKFKTGCRIFRI